MRTYKNILMGTVIGSVMFAFEAWGVCPGSILPPPYLTTDVLRSVTGVLAGVISLAGDGESKAQLIATQEANNQNTSGAGGRVETTDTSRGDLKKNLGSAKESEFSGSAFNYINEQLFAKKGNVTYKAIKDLMESDGNDDTVRADFRNMVVNEFFADPTKEEESTTEYKEKIRSNREKYTQEAANRHITLGYRIKDHIQNDLKVISSAAVSGDGELGSIAVDAHTLEQMVKMELVDLALQIEMMEAEAVHFLMNRPIELMSETKPAT